MALGSIVIDLLLKTGAFNNDAKLAERRLKDLGKEAKAAGMVIGTAFAGALTATAVQVRRLVQESKEITTLSRLSGEAAGKFQEWSVAADSVGIQQEKLADILKDTQDKVGDFLQTGGGAMADFFEQIAPKVGVTAEQFRKLSGSDALQLYYDSLQKANVSQSEMVFYMEAIASDSAKLAPLLHDTGDGFKYWADYAREAGAIMDDETLAATRKLDVEMSKMRISIDGLWKEALVGLIPKLTDFASMLNDPAFRQGFGYIINAAVTTAKVLIDLASTTARVMNFLGEEVAARMHGAARDDIVRMEQEVERIKEALQKVGSGSQRDLWDAGRRALGLPTTEELRARLGELYGAIEEYRRNPPTPARVSNFDPTGLGVLDAGSGNVRIDTAALDKAAAQAKKELAEANRLALKSEQEFTDKLIKDEEIRLDWLRTIEDLRAEMEGPAAVAALEYSRAIAEANAAMNLGYITAEEYGRYVDSLGEKHRKAVADINKSTDEMTVFAEQAQRNIQTTLGDSLYQALDGNFDGIADSFADMLKRMAAELMASQILKFFMGSGSQGGVFNLYGGSGFGFASGGYTGPGHRNQPAGVVHKGEVVWSQQDIAKAGGVGVVEAMRRGHRGYASGGVVGGFTGGGSSLKVEIENRGSPARVESASMSEAPDGTQIIRMVLGAVAGNVAEGGQVAQAMKGRFGLKEAI